MKGEYMNNDIKNLKIEEASDYLGLAKATLYHLKREGDIPSYKSGKYLLFKREDLDQHISATRVSAVTELEQLADEHMNKTKLN